MGFINKHLMSGETITYTTRLHWIIFFKALFMLAISVVFLIYGLSIIPKGVLSKIPPGIAGFSFQGLDLLRLAGIIILIYSAFFLWTPIFIRYISSEFGVSNKRVLIKTGFIKCSSFETLLTKVEGIIVEQGIWGRVLNFGTIIVTGTGGSKEYFDKIRNPIEFRKRVQEQIV